MVGYGFPGKPVQSITISRGRGDGYAHVQRVSLVGIGSPLCTLFNSPVPTPPTAPVNTGVVNTVSQQTSTPTDPTSSTITEETVEANVPTEEQTETETTPDGPVDMVALLERQPLVDGQVEVNNVVLSCQ